MRALPIAAPVALVMALVSCTTATESNSQPSAAEVIESAEDVQPNGAPRVLTLAAGQATITYAVQALDPPTHNIRVLVTAPSTADVQLWLDTHEPVRLDLVDSTLRDQSCTTAGPMTQCEVNLPYLEGRPEGIWNLTASKESGEAAEVEVTVSFFIP